MRRQFWPYTHKVLDRSADLRRWYFFFLRDIPPLIRRKEPLNVWGFSINFIAIGAPGRENAMGSFFSHFPSGRGERDFSRFYENRVDLLRSCVFRSHLFNFFSFPFRREREKRFYNEHHTNDYRTVRLLRNIESRSKNVNYRCGFLKIGTPCVGFGVNV